MKNFLKNKKDKNKINPAHYMTQKIAEHFSEELEKIIGFEMFSKFSIDPNAEITEEEIREIGETVYFHLNNFFINLSNDFKTDEERFEEMEIEAADDAAENIAEEVSWNFNLILRSVINLKLHGTVSKDPNKGTEISDEEFKEIIDAINKYFKIFFENFSNELGVKEKFDEAELNLTGIKIINMDEILRENENNE